MESPLDSIRQITQENLKLPDDDLPLVDYVTSILVASQRPGDRTPIWGWLVGRPAAGKTELVLPYKKNSVTVWLDDITQNALVSGYETDNGEDPSLYQSLPGKCVIMKDFAPMLTKSTDHVEAVMGELRSIFDGSYGKASGTVGIRNHEGKFGLLILVTPMIDAFSTIFQNLGERFLMMRMGRKERSREDREKHLKHVYIASHSNKKKWRTKIAMTTLKAFNNVRSFMDKNPTVEVPNDEIMDKIIKTSVLVASLRTRAFKGKMSEPESASRIIQQLVGIGEARILCSLRRGWEREDLDFILRVAADSIPPLISKAVKLVHSTPMRSDVLRNKLDAGNDFKDIKNQLKYTNIFMGGQQGLRLSTDAHNLLTKSGILRHMP